MACGDAVAGYVGCVEAGLMHGGRGSAGDHHAVLTGPKCDALLLPGFDLLLMGANPVEAYLDRALDRIRIDNLGRSPSVCPA